MSCYTCGSEFSFFKKEIGCEGCGFSFCGKCCKKQEVPIETGELKRQLVCNQCYNKKTKSQNSASSSNVSPPLAHKKRMESLKKQSYSVDSTKHSLLKSQWSDEKDKEIAERLQKLKRDRIKDLPTEDEIEQRIAKLKGMDPSRYTAPPIEVFRPADRRTSVEKADDLLKEITEKAKLDARIANEADAEIANRLAKLRASPTEKIEQNISKSDEAADSSLGKTNPIAEDELKNEPKTEEEEINLLLQQAKRQVSPEAEDVEMTEEEEADKLVEKLMASDFDADVEELDSLNDEEVVKSISSDEKRVSTEEFPWCVICTEDARIRCFGCDSDLYCLRCFKECHDSLDIKDHQTCPFLPPKKSSII